MHLATSVDGDEVLGVVRIYSVALYFALLADDTRLSALLVEQGALLLASESSVTPDVAFTDALRYAVVDGHARLVAELVTAGADVRVNVGDADMQRFTTRVDRYNRQR